MMFVPPVLVPVVHEILGVFLQLGPHAGVKVAPRLSPGEHLGEE
jgi:hypothetical protein